jgi:hypothetical protein
MDEQDRPENLARCRRMLTRRASSIHERWRSAPSLPASPTHTLSSTKPQVISGVLPAMPHDDLRVARWSCV